jgi:hypothetical protein
MVRVQRPVASFCIGMIHMPLSLLAVPVGLGFNVPTDAETCTWEAFGAMRRNVKV